MAASQSAPAPARQQQHGWKDLVAGVVAGVVGTAFGAPPYAQILIQVSILRLFSSLLCNSFWLEHEFPFRR